MMNDQARLPPLIAKIEPMLPSVSDSRQGLP